MGGNGPPPKDPEHRQRRNRPASEATLPAERRPIKGTPKLPTIASEEEHEWNPLTVAWWKETWASPLASQYMRADLNGLYMLAYMIDQYWTRPSPDLAREIRLQRQAFGMTPSDRRRLGWGLAQQRKGGTAKRAGAAAEPAAPEGDDPRKVLPWPS